MYDIKEIKYIERYKIEITFENEKKGIVDFEEYIKKGGVFERFSDIEYFKEAYIDKELGVLCWPNEVDIAPETLYTKATGEALPDWIIKEQIQPIVVL